MAIVADHSAGASLGKMVGAAIGTIFPDSREAGMVRLEDLMVILELDLQGVDYRDCAVAGVIVQRANNGPVRRMVTAGQCVKPAFCVIILP
ncbi:hypothetical protein, partial [Acidocella aminolytica]|uniref:hypothetical protein n=2 Tax=Acidocella aminolytica TaxID=33998 RepID=UPI002230F385